MGFVCIFEHGGTSVIDNTVADAISRLEYDPHKNVKDLSVAERFGNFATLFTHYMQKHGGDKTAMADSYEDCDTQPRQCHAISQQCVSEPDGVFFDLFANMTQTEEDEIYPVTVREIAAAQKRSCHYKAFFP